MPTLSPAEISQIAAQVADEISSLMKGEMASKIMDKKMPPGPPDKSEDPALDTPETDDDAMEAMASDMPAHGMPPDDTATDDSTDPLAKKKPFPFAKKG
jgi:hypothetical protein